jgi:hypothetical protein
VLDVITLEFLFLYLTEAVPFLEFVGLKLRQIFYKKVKVIKIRLQ